MHIAEKEECVLLLGLLAKRFTDLMREIQGQFFVPNSFKKKINTLAVRHENNWLENWHLSPSNSSPVCTRPKQTGLWIH